MDLGLGRADGAGSAAFTGQINPVPPSNSLDILYYIPTSVLPRKSTVNNVKKNLSLEIIFSRQHSSFHITGHLIEKKTDLVCPMRGSYTYFSISLFTDSKNHGTPCSDQFSENSWAERAKGPLDHSCTSPVATDEAQIDRRANTRLLLHKQLT